MDNTFWTPRRLAEAKELESKGGRGHAAAVLSERYGHHVTRESIRSAYRRSAGEGGSLTPARPAIVAPRAQDSIIGASADRVETRVVLPDAHIPAHHRKAFATMKAIVKEVCPDRVILLGDWMDTYSLSHHPPRTPARTRFVDETEAAERELDDVRNAAPSAEFYELEGNHEGWASGYEAGSPSLEGVLNVPERLRLAEKGIRWVPLFEQDSDEGRHFRLGPVAYLHAVFEGATAARKHAEIYGPRIGCRYVKFGHTHGMDSYTSPAGYTARSGGFLGDRRNIAFSYTKGRPCPWVLGFTIEEISGNTVTDTEIRIDYDTGRAVFRGRAYGPAV